MGLFFAVYTYNSDLLALSLTRFLLNKRTQGFWYRIFTWLTHCTVNMAYIDEGFIVAHKYLCISEIVSYHENVHTKSVWNSKAQKINFHS